MLKITILILKITLMENMIYHIIETAHMGLPIGQNLMQKGFHIMNIVR